MSCTSLLPFRLSLPGWPTRAKRAMSNSFAGETKKTAVSQRAVTSNTRDVLTKQVKAGQETVVATEPKKRDGGNLDTITGGCPVSFGGLGLCGLVSISRQPMSK